MLTVKTRRCIRKMNVRKVVKKITALGVGATMLGATIFGAAAADLSNFPKPLFVNANTGVVDSLFVLGENAKSTDTLGMNAIVAAIQASAVKRVPIAGTDSKETVALEDGVNLNSGSDEVWFGTEINDQTQTLTDEDLSFLGDETFREDDGTSFDYEMTLDIGVADFTFSDANGELEDPELIIQGEEISDDTDEWYYAYVVEFDEPVDFFNNADATGEKLTLFGKDYTIGSDSTATRLQLLGGDTEVTLMVGETKEVTFGEETYNIEFLGVNGADASLTINGVFKKVTEGDTANVAGIDIYADVVSEFSGTENNGLITLLLQSDELWLEDGKKVKMGTDEDAVDGTYVDMSADINTLDSIKVYIGAPDKDVAFLTVGDTATDDVFGAVQLAFADVSDDLMSDSRHVIDFSRAADDTFQVEFSDGDEEFTIEFSDNSALETEDGEAIHIAEGEQVTEDDYFFLNSGDFQHLMQLTDIDVSSDDDADAEITIEDQFSGDSYTWEFTQATFAGEVNGSFNLKGQTYYVQAADGADSIWGSADDFVIFSKKSDYIVGDNASESIQVFQYIEPVAGKDFRVGFFESITLDSAFVNNTAYTFETPTGSFTYTTDDNDAENKTAGEMTYEVTTNAAGTAITITPVVGATEITVPSFFLVEEENDADSNAQGVMVMRTTDGGTYTEMVAPIYTGTLTHADYDNADYDGYVSSYGTFAYMDASDDDQTELTVYYSAEQLYASVFIGPAAAETTTTVSGGYSEVPVQIPSNLFVYDSEVQDPMAQSMVVVGGPCANSVAAALLGVTNPNACAEGFELGKGMVKLFDSADGMNAGKVAMLVAGYSGDDTRRTANVLANYAEHADKLTGSEVVVMGTTGSDVSIMAPEEVPTPEPEAEPEAEPETTPAAE